MDPALQELLRSNAADQEVEAILRLTDPAARIPGVRRVSRFGSIITCRLTAHSVLQTRALDQVASVKAPRLLGPEASPVALEYDPQWRASDIRRPSGVPYTGKVIVGFLDWGFAFANSALRHPDGRTRLLALWDQRRRDPARPNHYGYGIIHDAVRINAALRSSNPYVALGYHPAESDSARIGAHGSVTVDIAVGNGRGGSPMGLAPEADIVCVHLATEAHGTSPLETLGDSSRVLESIDFIRRMAAGRPFVVSASIGRHGGPHDGTTLVEAAEDTLADRPNCVVVHSTGNYASRSVHASGRLRDGDTRAIRLQVDSRDRSENEIEVWYNGASRLSVRVEWPGGGQSSWITLGERVELVTLGRVIARVYHRARDPQNGDNLIDIFIDAGAPAGEWRVALRAEAGPPSGTEFHAWIERDDACVPCQAKFHADDTDSSVTTSTLANARRTISVGAVNAHDPALPIAPFSSAGPTRDGRSKPDCVAPGVAVLALRSPWFSETDARTTTRRSGTSMAAPYVAGCAALVLEAGRGLLGPDEVRELILTNTDDAGAGADSNRYGHGYVNLERAIAAAEQVARRRATSPARSFVDFGARGSLMKEHTDVNNPVLEVANQFLENARNTSADEFLRALVGELGSAGSSRSALQLFRDVRGEPATHGVASLGDGITVVARPGERFDALQPGDVILRRPLGEGRGIHVALVAGPELRHDQLGREGLVPEVGKPGWFARVIEGGSRPHSTSDRFARRTRDAWGRNTADQVVIRFATAERHLAPLLSEGAAAVSTTVGSVDEILDDFRKDTSSKSAWLQLPSGREDVAKRLQELVKHPRAINQASANLCGPAVFVRFWIARDPVNFVRYATEIYNTGHSRIGSLDVSADGDLLKYTLPSAPFPHPNDPTRKLSPPHAADWVVMAALRDSENVLIDYQQVDDEAAGITFPSEVAEWMEATGVYKQVRNEGDWKQNATLSHASGLGPLEHDVALLIHTKMIDGLSTGFLYDAFPNHYVALENSVTSTKTLGPSQRVRFPYWSWGMRDNADVLRALFDATYFGAVIGVPK